MELICEVYCKYLSDNLWSIDQKLSGFLVLRRQMDYLVAGMSPEAPKYSLVMARIAQRPELSRKMPMSSDRSPL